MTRIKIYYDHRNDRLTFTNHRHITAKPVAIVNVPEGTKKDGNCVILSDDPHAIFPLRRVTPTELYIRAHSNWGEGISIAEINIHGMHTFSAYGRIKTGDCIHGKTFPCHRCNSAREFQEQYGTSMNDEEFKERFTRKKSWEQKNDQNGKEANS